MHHVTLSGIHIISIISYIHTSKMVIIMIIIIMVSLSIGRLRPLNYQGRPNAK